MNFYLFTFKEISSNITSATNNPNKTGSVALSLNSSTTVVNSVLNSSNPNQMPPNVNEEMRGTEFVMLYDYKVRYSIFLNIIFFI